MQTFSLSVLNNYADRLTFGLLDSSRGLTPFDFLRISTDKSHPGNLDRLIANAGTTIAKARDDKKAEG